MLQGVVVQVQTGVLGEMRGAEQGAGPYLGAAPAVGPAVQRANQVARGTARLLVLQRSAPFEHDRLAVPAYVGDQLDPLRRAHQSPATALLGQHVVVSDFRNRQSVPHIAGPGLEDPALLTLVQRLVKVAGNW